MMDCPTTMRWHFISSGNFGTACHWEGFVVEQGSERASERLLQLVLVVVGAREVTIEQYVIGNVLW